MTNEVSSGKLYAIDHNWTIQIAKRDYGLVQWNGDTTIILSDRVFAKLPFSVPVTVAAFVLIVLLLLVAGYYLIGNLRHKDAPGDAKLD